MASMAYSGRTCGAKLKKECGIQRFLPGRPGFLRSWRGEPGKHSLHAIRAIRGGSVDLFWRKIKKKSRVIHENQWEAWLPRTALFMFDG